MKGLIWFVLIIVAWFILNRYILPKLGVDT
jgi:p-aminobenzoyl-glutamate transporter AbgT